MLATWYYKGRTGNKVYESVLLRQCYYESGKIKQKTIANLSNLPEHVIRAIELSIKKDEVYYKLEDLNFEDGFSYGHIASLEHIINDIGLNKVIYSVSNKERDLALAMIICRIVHPASELETTRWVIKQEAFKEFYNLDYSKLRVDHLYRALDWLESRQKQIEANLYRKRNEKPRLFLYDITSTYFEGEKAELSAFGYNRDKKRGKKQVVIGLVTDKDGYPLSIEVFKGNTSDRKTLIPKIESLKKIYGLEEAIIVGDRGLITESNISDVEKNGFRYISALTRRRIEQLIKDSSTSFQLGLFDERKITEIEYNKKRYILCKNKEKAVEDRETLYELLGKTKKKFDEIRELVRVKKLKGADKIGMKVGKWKNRWKVGKYFKIEIGEGKFEYQVKEEDLKIREALCGCYVITTTVSKGEMNSKEVVEHYKRLTLVERAFELMKTMLLQIQPVYHSIGRRIKAHAFLCMLAYYVTLEFKNRLKELFSENGSGRDYKWTLENLLYELQGIKVGYMKVGVLQIKQIKGLNEEQKKIIKCLGVKLKVTKEVIH